MSERYFVEPPVSGDTAELTGAEAQHLSRVMRAKVGDEVCLFDGSGYEFSGVIRAIDRGSVRLDIVARELVDRELPFKMTLAISLPKGDRQKVLIEKLTELGVTELIPLTTSRSVVRPDTGSLDRLRRGVLEASKQCRRNRLMTIGDAESLSDLVQSRSDFERRLIAHPYPEGKPHSGQLSAASNSQPLSVIVLVGPEGGFSSDEVNQATGAGWSLVSLGPRILRVETAAIAIASELSLGRSLCVLNGPGSGD